MAKGKIKWHFPDDGGGEGRGFNDAGADKFLYSGSIYRETAQNSLDQWDRTTGEPCVVYFKSIDYEPSVFNIGKDIKNIFKKCGEYDAVAADKGDGVDFYKVSKSLLNKNIINVLCISDYNTNGLKMHPHDIKSAYHRLVVAPGTSTTSGMGGGSHGHGQKATFAVSNLRTVFYYSYVKDGIENFNSKELFVGKSILNSWKDDEDVSRQPTGYMGDIWEDSENNRIIKTFPLSDIDIPKQISRISREGDIPTGTDIFILEPKINYRWTDTAEKQIVKNFFGSIEAGFLEIGLSDKKKQNIHISKNNLDSIIMKHSSEASHYLKALREPVNGKPFEKKIDKLGLVKLYISQHDGGNQKIAIMRKPRMLLQEMQRKVLSNFSGVLLVEDDEGNNNLRLAENARHDKIQKIHMRKHFPPEVDFIGDLHNFIDETLDELKGTTTHEKLEIPGLGNLLPGNKPKNKSGDTESDDDENAPSDEIRKAKIVKVTTPKLRAPKVSKIREIDNVDVDEDGDTKRMKKRKKKKIKIKKKFKKGEGDEKGIVPSKDINVRTYLISNQDSQNYYFVKIKILKDADGYIGFTFIGQDDIRVIPKLSSLHYGDESSKTPEYKIRTNLIYFGKLKKGDTLVFDLKVKDNIPASLGVLG